MTYQERIRELEEAIDLLDRQIQIERASKCPKCNFVPKTFAEMDSHSKVNKHYGSWITNENARDFYLLEDWEKAKSKFDGLKEGYSLGKQDMITEIEKKGKTNAGQRFTTCDNDIFIDCFEWQALKKREGIE